ncbi:MAG: GntR family transcriptional regulator [Chloroflexi bacterium]|nr:GntR family transcriptional regulator [Chloroflexota bacterium]
MKSSNQPEARVRRGVLLGSLAEQVYRRLRTMIIQGDHAPGGKLVELDIAAAMGTSQGTVRDALHRLEREGLVERQAHRGTLVTAVAPDEIYELFVIRSTIEGFAVRRAVVRIQPDDIQRLEDLLSAMRHAAAEQDIIQLAEYDMAFHRTICEWSGSRVLLNAWLPLYSQIQRFVVQTHPHYFHDLNNLADTHVPLLDAIKQRDADRAADLLQQHIMLIWSWIEAEHRTNRK